MYKSILIFLALTGVRGNKKIRITFTIANKKLLHKFWLAHFLM